jgi:hypothetical protein
VQEHFFHKESAELVAVMDDVGRRHSGRERVFDDFLTMVVCCLAGGTREEEYLATIQPYVAGEKGKRDVDKLAELFARLVNVMEETREDILGDVFQGAITRGLGGQFFTPDCIATLMAKLTTADDAREGTETPEGSEEAPAPESSFGKTVADPCCGSGRLLLAAAKENRNRYFVGQDIDHRCAKIAAINLALWNLVGKVIWGNSLTLECKRVYHTGFNGRGVIRVEEPVPAVASPMVSEPETPETLPAPPLDDEPLRQGSLFGDSEE